MAKEKKMEEKAEVPKEAPELKVEAPALFTQEEVDAKVAEATSKLTNELITLQESLNQRNLAVEDVTKRWREAEGKLVKAKASSSPDNTVFIDGQSFPIKHRAVANFIGDDVKRGYVHPDMTVVAIDKAGG